jgi:Ser/Thr protein kinase RdoA (MazF antagonist)
VDVPLNMRVDPVARIRERIRSDLDLCIGLGTLGDRDRIVLRQAETLIGALNPESSRTVLRHGDFWPGNVFVLADAIEVVDFEATSAGLPFEDVAYFLLHLDLYLNSGARGRRRHALRSALLRAFLAGAPMDVAALELGTISAVLQVLAHAHASPSRVRQWRKRHALQRVIRAASRNDVDVRTRAATEPLEAMT